MFSNLILISQSIDVRAYLVFVCMYKECHLLPNFQDNDILSLKKYRLLQTNKFLL